MEPRTRPGTTSCSSTPSSPGVENPLLAALDAVPDPERKTVADLGCGTGPLLPHLVGRFGEVIALDFAPGDDRTAPERGSARDADRVTFLARPMHDLDDLAGALDVAVAVNSLVMPDVRLIDRTLRPIRAASGPAGSSSASCRRWTRSITTRCC